MLKKVLKNLSFMCLSLAITGAIFANEQTKDLACKALDNFCQSEFQYNVHNRYDLIKMSEPYKDKLEKLTGTSIGTLYISDAYEILAVKSYKILNVSVNGNEAVATVSYDVVAKRTGWNSAARTKTIDTKSLLEKYINQNYIEKINLTFDGNRWWVLDPPAPKISLDKIISFYEDSLGRYRKNALELTNPVAINNVKNLCLQGENTIALLKSLR